MKKLSLIVAITITVDSLFVAALNSDKFINITYNLADSYFGSNLAIMISLAFFLGSFCAFSISYYSLKQLQSKLNKQERNKEKAQITAEESSDKVKLLEEKIKTLETALQSVLSK